MWEVLTIALCGLGFTAAITVLLIELVKLLSSAAGSSRSRPQ